MSTPAPSILSAFDDADWRASQKLPYVFGGGHSSRFQPSGSPAGYDCSGWVSTILHHAGILGSSEALDTHALERWGLAGRGEFMTVWTINVPGLEHTFIEFKVLGHLTKRWSAANHTGAICGWVPWMDPAGYTARRRP